MCLCTNERYLIPSLDRSHAGFYRCIVRNRVGALLQRRTEVQVACKYMNTGCGGIWMEVKDLQTQKHVSSCTHSKPYLHLVPLKKTQRTDAARVKDLHTSHSKCYHPRQLFHSAFSLDWYCRHKFFFNFPLLRYGRPVLLFHLFCQQHLSLLAEMALGCAVFFPANFPCWFRGHSAPSSW